MGLLLGAWFRLGPWRPYQDRSQRHWHRYPALRAAHAQLWRCRIVPRRQRRRPLSVDPRHFQEDRHWHFLSYGTALLRMLFRKQRWHVQGRRLDMQPQEHSGYLRYFGEACGGLSHYPNATVAEYGSISGKAAMQKEIASRGPIACGIDANPLRDYTSGVVTTAGGGIDHVISVVGWGNDDKEGLFWIVRNSWGEYWGEQGFVRVKSGALNVEDQCAWATLQDFTAPERNNQ